MFLADKGLKVRYLHSDIETLDRVEILVDLRMGHFDVLVGVNLLGRGAGSARGLARGDPGRGQGGVPRSPLCSSSSWGVLCNVGGGSSCTRTR